MVMACVVRGAYRCSMSNDAKRCAMLMRDAMETRQGTPPCNIRGPQEAGDEGGVRATVTLQDICCEKIRGCSYREAVRLARCPLCLDNDQIPQRSEMTRCVNCRDGATMSRRLIGDRAQPRARGTMKLKRAMAAMVLVSAFAAPLAAGTFEDAVDAHARGDYAKALRLIRPLANDGNATAQFNLGVMYLTGRGVQQDYSAAALWFRKAAEQGYALAQTNLGTLYRDGRGVTQGYAEAVIWYRKAADQGDAVAEFLLGNQYAFGKGVPQDYSEAMRWFRKAAEQGHPRAMHDLGVIYAKGLGLPQDYVRAHMWFSLSAAQGEQRAVKALAMAEQRMTPARIKRSAEARTRLEAGYAAISSLA